MNQFILLFEMVCSNQQTQEKNTNPLKVDPKTTISKIEKFSTAYAWGQNEAIKQ